MSDNKQKTVEQKQQEGFLWVSGIVAVLTAIGFVSAFSHVWIWWETTFYTLVIAVLTFGFVFLVLCMAMQRRYKDEEAKMRKDFPEYYPENMPEEHN